MNSLFYNILKMSLAGTYVIFIVIMARILLRKSPKIFSYLLWIAVAIRLLIPFSFASPISIFPKVISPRPTEYVISPKFSIGRQDLIEELNKNKDKENNLTVNYLNKYKFVTGIWIIGIAGSLIYSLNSLDKLKKRIKSPVHIKDNIYEIRGLDTPFTMGILNPVIYLPEGLQDDEREYILIHEQIHIKRKDHIIKPLAFIILSLHWFNPFIWISFYMMSKDMEEACDERVIEIMGGDIKKSYANSLLNFATGKYNFNCSLLSFGDGDIKSRIKNILSYNNSPLWKIILSTSFVLSLIFLLALSPNAKEKVYISNKGNLIEVEIGSYKEFSENEIENAVKYVVQNFPLNYCELKKIYYDEEKMKTDVNLFMEHGMGKVYDVDKKDVIILYSDFQVDNIEYPILLGLDGNRRYEDYNWILVRDGKNDDWRLGDQGY